MNAAGWIQILLFVVGLVLITKPMGIYLIRVLDPEKEGGLGLLEKAFGPVERMVYAAAGVDPKKQHNWKQYTVSLLVFAMVTMLISYLLFRMQAVLPGQAALNPQGFPAMSDTLSFIQAASFMTNTDWQSYTPEATMSYFTQTVSLGMHLFFSAAVGIAVAAALVRGVSRRQTTDIGNFWVDLTRITLYLMLPICVFYAIFLAWQGTPMNFRHYTDIKALVDPTASGVAAPAAAQSIVQGPMASFCAPKMLGLNGPGFTNANCAHPFEDPTPLSDFIQVLSFFAIPAGLVYYYGRMIKNTRHAWNIWAAMFVLLIAGIVASWYFESQPNPRLADLGIDPAYANMEGKEVRHGIFRSTVWADEITATAAGANNCRHDSLMPLTGFVTMFNMHLGEVVFGGIGSGLYGVLVFIFVAVFLAGLMIGRTPEYLGKKIEGYDVKLAAFFLLLTVITSCGFTAYAVINKWGTDGMNNGGPHGFSEVLYAYSSATANNGSAFGGLTCTPTNLDRHYNISMAFCILFGRFFQIIPVMGLAGALARKKPLATSSVASFPVTGFTFVTLVVSVILIVGALNFFPSLALGPIVEHFVMTGSKTLY